MNPLIGIGAGLVGGLFGGGSEAEVPGQTEWALKFLKRLSKQYLQDSQSVPLSLPQEQLALAQARGMAGEDFRGAYQGLLAMLGTNGPTADSAGDALVRFQEGAQGNLMSLNQQALMQALGQRQAWRAQAGQFAGQVGSMGLGTMQGPTPGTDFTPIFQALGQMIGQRGFTPQRTIGTTHTPGALGTAMGNAVNYFG